MNKKKKKAKEIISTILYLILDIVMVALVILCFKSVISVVELLVSFCAMFICASLIESWEDSSKESKKISSTARATACGERNKTTEFIRPIGIIKTPWNGEKSFMDYYGHEYHELGGVIYDENGNFVPDYMKDYYGLPSYDDND
ncbi:MAG: hypothetical protein IJG59_09805 [Erysipelotrichaceae bacterium]|nr:hypothetical protein [Erysipelotrichaceae bacterium]